MISLLKGITAEGVTVIATIHSPTAYAFSLFDRWGFLAGCGRMPAETAAGRAHACSSA